MLARECFTRMLMSHECLRYISTQYTTVDVNTWVLNNLGHNDTESGDGVIYQGPLQSHAKNRAVLLIMLARQSVALSGHLCNANVRVKAGLRQQAHKDPCRSP